MLEMDQIVGNTVGHGPLEMIPHKLRRVEFRGILGESLDAQAWMFPKAGAKGGATMDSAIVPQQDHRTLHGSEQIPEKLGHLGVSEVLIRMESGIQSNPPSLGRHADCRDRLNLAPMAGTLQDRGLSPRRPSPADVRDEQKSTLIEEDQVGPTSVGVFLYGANDSASSVRSPSRPALEPVSPASDNSSPDPPEPSTHDADGNGSQTSGR